jgi:hypothetical protein
MRIGLIVGLALLFAGCTADGTPAGPQSGPPAASVAAPGGPVAGAATIRATVVDDAGLPIAEATIAILELEIAGRSDVAGAVVFSNLNPGRYTVAAAHAGFDGDEKHVEVGVEETAAVVFRLVAVPTDAPYHETLGPLQGFFQCRASVRLMATESWTGHCGSVCAGAINGCVSPLSSVVSQNDNSVLLFSLSSPRVATIVGDMQWSQSSFATSTSLRFALSHEGRNAAHWWCSAEGANPLQFRYELQGPSVCTNVGSHLDPLVPTMEMVLRMYANTPFGTEQNPYGLTFQQRFEVVASVFYGSPAPETYSGFVDA